MRWPVLSSAVLLLSCGPNEDRVRQIVTEELAHRQTLRSINEGETIGPYAPAVRAGDFVFVSGQIGLDPATGKLAGDSIEVQTRQALRNLGAVLRAAGCDSSDVAQCTVYMTDMNMFPRMNLVYGGFFADDRYPTRATVEVRRLPRDAAVEIAAVAYHPLNR